MKKAFTLVEFLIYIALFSITATMVTSLVVKFIQTTRTINALKEIQENEKIAIDTISQEVKQSLGVYIPTSVFGTNPGQLSLETKNYLPPQEQTTYVDFYVDGQGIYRKRENEAPSRITSQGVEVTNFTTVLISQAQIPAIRIDLTLASTDLPNSSFPISFTVSLRSNQ